jgi:hypothetical protein
MRNFDLSCLDAVIAHPEKICKVINIALNAI